MRKLFPYCGNGSMDDRRKQINYLIEHCQPFMLAAYPVKASMVEDYKAVDYELILWQTRSGDDSLSSLLMDRVTFEDLVAEYNMKQLADNEHGMLYGIDDSMMRLSRMMDEEIGSLNDDLRVTTKRLMISKGDETKRLRLLREAILREIRNCQQRFEKDQQIIKFSFREKE